MQGLDPVPGAYSGIISLQSRRSWPPTSNTCRRAFVITPRLVKDPCEDQDTNTVNDSSLLCNLYRVQIRIGLLLDKQVLGMGNVHGKFVNVLL